MRDWLSGFAFGLICGVYGGRRSARLLDGSEATSASEAGRLPACNIVLLVATKTEAEILERVAAELGEFSRHESDLGEYFDLGQRGSNRVLAVKVRMGPLRYRGAAWQTIMLRNATGATGFIAVGTAFGVNRREQKTGDILVATHMLPYDDRSVHADKNTGKLLVDRSRARPRAAKDSLVGMMRRCAEREQRFTVHFGRLLSGSAQIQSSRFRDELIRAFDSKVIGGDMEAVALATSCDPARPNWAVVKGISDFGDENRHTDIVQGRTVAAENAVRFVLGALAARPEERP